MTFIISMLTIILGYTILLLSIGHLILVIRIAIPATKILKRAGLLKYGQHGFYTPLAIIVFVLISYIFYNYFATFFVYLIFGYFIASLVIIKNFKNRYSFNEESFKNWYLKDFYEQLNFDTCSASEKKTFQDTDNLYNFVFTILKSKAYKKNYKL